MFLSAAAVRADHWPLTSTSTGTVVGLSGDVVANASSQATKVGTKTRYEATSSNKSFYTIAPGGRSALSFAGHGPPALT